MIYRQVSVKWPKWIAVEISSCLGRSGSVCRQAAATKLGVGMARASAKVLQLFVSSYLVVGRRVTPMIYRQVSVKWPKWIVVEISSWFGRSGSACRQAAAPNLGVNMARASAQVLPLSVSAYHVVGRRVTPMIYRQVSVKWPKWNAVEISSCLGRSGSACRQVAATKLGVAMARAPAQVLPLSVSSFLVVGRRVTPMIYRQVSVKWPKWIAVEISSWLGRSGSACREAAATKLRVGMARASAQVLPLSVSSYLIVGRRVIPMIYRQVSVKWPKWIAVEISSCLGRSGSACRQVASTKLGVAMARA